MLDIAPPQEIVWISDRADFWNADRISDQTAVLDLVNAPQYTGKRILFLIHGFNTDETTIETSYKAVSTFLCNLKDADGKPLYDLLIGYVWPGYDSLLEYYDAEAITETPQLKDRLGSTLQKIAASAATFDVLAHSMGNRLILEALSSQVGLAKPLIRYYYSFAAAVNDHSPEKKHRYAAALKLCESVYIFHSSVDLALTAYKFLEDHRALGAEGNLKLVKMPSNIQFIDCTNILYGDHSAYFTPAASPIYRFIQNQHAHPTLAPVAQKWHLLEDGSLQPGDIVLSWPETLEYLGEALESEL